MSSVLLIYPFFKPRRDRSIFRFPPLGIGYLAASLREAGHTVQLLDCTFSKRSIALEQAKASQAQVIGETVDGLYREWLPESGYQADDKPPLEIYYQPSGEGISMDYCLPLKPL